MKVLTIRQPWLRAITHGTKRTENRNRAPSKYLIGERIGLHAGRAIDSWYNWHTNETMMTVFTEGGGAGRRGNGRVSLCPDHEFHLGCIIATAVLVGYVRVGPMTIRGIREYDVSHAPKRYRPDNDQWLANRTANVGWLFEDVQILPIAMPARGQLFVWDWELPATREAWA